MRLKALYGVRTASCVASEMIPGRLVNTDCMQHLGPVGRLTTGEKHESGTELILHSLSLLTTAQPLCMGIGFVTNVILKGVETFTLPPNSTTPSPHASHQCTS